MFEMYASALEILKAASNSGSLLLSRISKRYVGRRLDAPHAILMNASNQFVEPQRKVADLIVPRGIENRVALGKIAIKSLEEKSGLTTVTADMMVQFIEKKLFEKSIHHREALARLEIEAQERPLSNRVIVLSDTVQLRFMNTIVHDIDTSAEDFIFYFDRLARLIIEQ